MRKKIIMLLIGSLFLFIDEVEAKTFDEIATGLRSYVNEANEFSECYNSNIVATSSIYPSDSNSSSNIIIELDLKEGADNSVCYDLSDFDIVFDYNDEYILFQSELLTIDANDYNIRALVDMNNYWVRKMIEINDFDADYIIQNTPINADYYSEKERITLVGSTISLSDENDELELVSYLQELVISYKDLVEVVDITLNSVSFNINSVLSCCIASLYDVYRSTDNINYEKIGEEYKSLGTFENSFVDNNLLSNIKYYYKFVFDDEVKTEKIISITTLSDKTEVLPNEDDKDIYGNENNENKNNMTNDVENPQTGVKSILIILFALIVSSYILFRVVYKNKIWKV